MPLGVVLREYLSTGYGLRFSTEIYGSKWEKTVFHEYLQEYCFVITSPKISGNLPEFTGECSLGILYSSSLLGVQRLSVACACGGPDHLWLGEKSGELKGGIRAITLTSLDLVKNDSF